MNFLCNRISVNGLFPTFISTICTVEKIILWSCDKNYQVQNIVKKNSLDLLAVKEKERKSKPKELCHPV
jgi:hypothetical protein